VAADIKVVIKLIDQGYKFKAFRIANDDFKMKVNLEKNKDSILPNISDFVINLKKGIV